MQQAHQVSTPQIHSEHEQSSNLFTPEQKVLPQTQKMLPHNPASSAAEHQQHDQ